MGSTCKCSNYPERKAIPVPSFPAPGEQNSCNNWHTEVSIHSLLTVSGFLGRIPHKVACDCLGWSMTQGHALAAQTIISEAYSTIKNNQGCPHPLPRPPPRCEPATAIDGEPSALDEQHSVGASATAESLSL